MDVAVTDTDAEGTVTVAAAMPTADGRVIVAQGAPDTAADGLGMAADVPVAR
jgi:hypothetical protein